LETLRVAIETKKKDANRVGSPVGSRNFMPSIRVQVPPGWRELKRMRRGALLGDFHRIDTPQS